MFPRARKLLGSARLLQLGRAMAERKRELQASPVEVAKTTAEKIIGAVATLILPTPTSNTKVQRRAAAPRKRPAARKAVAKKAVKKAGVGRTATPQKTARGKKTASAASTSRAPASKRKPRQPLTNGQSRSGQRTTGHRA
jgi:hypothetical protein